jgi:hypothetical protein
VGSPSASTDSTEQRPASLPDGRTTVDDDGTGYDYCSRPQYNLCLVHRALVQISPGSKLAPTQQVTWARPKPANLPGVSSARLGWFAALGLHSTAHETAGLCSYPGFFFLKKYILFSSFAKTGICSGRVWRFAPDDGRCLPGRIAGAPAAVAPVFDAGAPAWVPPLYPFPPLVFFFY